MGDSECGHCNIQGFQAAVNIALDLDERPMPKGPMFPRCVICSRNADLGRDSNIGTSAGGEDDAHGVLNPLSPRHHSMGMVGLSSCTDSILRYDLDSPLSSYSIYTRAILITFPVRCFISTFRLPTSELLQFEVIDTKSSPLRPFHDC